MEGIGRTSPMFGSLTLAAFGLLCSRPLCLGFRTRWSFLSPCSSWNSRVYSRSASLQSPPLIQRREVPAEIFRSPRVRARILELCSPSLTVSMCSVVILSIAAKLVAICLLLRWSFGGDRREFCDGYWCRLMGIGI